MVPDDRVHRRDRPLVFPDDRQELPLSDCGGGLNRPDAVLQGLRARGLQRKPLGLEPRARRPGSDQPRHLAPLPRPLLGLELLAPKREGPPRLRSQGRLLRQTLLGDEAQALLERGHRPPGLLQFGPELVEPVRWSRAASNATAPRHGGGPRRPVGVGPGPRPHHHGPLPSRQHPSFFSCALRFRPSPALGTGPRHESPLSGRARAGVASVLLRCGFAPPALRNPC